MLAEECWASLPQELQNSGYIEVANQVNSLGVSTATIRRDLDRLQREGQVIRTRGGAVLLGSSTTLELP